MAVPVVTAASRSPSPAKPLPIDTVAPTRRRLSGSPTRIGAPTVTGAPLSVKVAVPGTLASVGALLIGVTLIVVVATVLRLLEAAPSSRSQVRVRVGFEP